MIFSRENGLELFNSINWRVSFIEVEIPSSPGQDDELNYVRLTDHHHNLTVNGKSYLASSGLISIGEIKKDIEVKDESIIITLNGINRSISALVLTTQVKGSKVNIYRGFYDEDTGELVSEAFKVWAGRVDAVGIRDNRNIEGEEGENETVGISIDCRNLVSILRDRESGLYTSSRSWEKYFPGDTSMQNVAGLVNRDFNFGKDK